MKVNKNLIVLDTETSGFTPDKNSLTQIAFIAVDSFTFEEKARYNTYIKPYDNSLIWNQQASELTGITKEKCEMEGKDLRIVLDEICQIFKSLKVSYYIPSFVGANFQFDSMFLENVFDRIYGENSGKGKRNKLYDYVNSSALDIQDLARQTFINDELANFKLETIGDFIGVENRSAHDGLADVEQTLEIYKYFILRMRNGNNSNNIDLNKVKFNFQF